MGNDTLELYQDCRKRGFPLLAIKTSDQLSLAPEVEKQTKELWETEFPILLWDLHKGLVGLNEQGLMLSTSICQGKDPALVTGNPSEMLKKLVTTQDMENITVICMNFHRYLANESIAVGIMNLRNTFEGNGSCLVMLGSSFKFPEELEQDVQFLVDELPDKEAIKTEITKICEDSGMGTPDSVEKESDALLGMSTFAARQVMSLSIRRNTDSQLYVDFDRLWERKCTKIAEVKGLSVFQGKETFDDIQGYENFKTYMKLVLKGKKAPNAVVLIDEIDKMFAGVGTDTSGTTTENLGTILSFMQDNDVMGILSVGHPGTSKSMMTKASGNYICAPSINFDIGGTKASLVGQSGDNLRQCLKVLKVQGRLLFMGTCNSVANLPLALRRRFTLGTFHFDLPTDQEKIKIWVFYQKKYDLDLNDIKPDDTGWTGAEIKQCCDLSWNLGIPLIQASTYITPIYRAAPEEIDRLNQEASGRYISASYPGVYRIDAAPTTKASKQTSRKMSM